MRHVIAALHPRIIDGGLDSGAVDIERRARRAYLSQLDFGVAGTKALPEAQLAAVETASGEVFAQRAGDTIALSRWNEEKSA